MPSYAYNDGDGLAVIDKTLPNGAVEPVSNLDDAIKQIKAYLKDSTAGVAKIQADITAGTASIAALDTRLGTAETTIATHTTQIVDLGVSQAATQAQVDALVVTAGGAPITCIVGLGAAQDCFNTDILNGVNFNTVEIDTNNAFNTTTHMYVIPLAGLYSVVASVKLSTTASSAPGMISHRLVIKINGVEAAEAVTPTTTNTDDRTLELTRVFQTAATNTIEVLYKVTTGSGTMTSQIQTSVLGSMLQISRVSA